MFKIDLLENKSDFYGMGELSPYTKNILGYKAISEGEEKSLYIFVIFKGEDSDGLLSEIGNVITSQIASQYSHFHITPPSQTSTKNFDLIAKQTSMVFYRNFEFQMGEELKEFDLLIFESKEQEIYNA